MYGKQFIYQQFVGAKVIHPNIIKNIIENVNGKNIKDSINTYFDFDKSICVYSNNDKAVDFEF